MSKDSPRREEAGRVSCLRLLLSCARLHALSLGHAMAHACCGDREEKSPWTLSSLADLKLSSGRKGSAACEVVVMPRVLSTLCVASRYRFIGEK
eukprot:6353984-Amphidinium_carterae.1